MVELSETSDILRTITPRTLVILDEWVIAAPCE
jgi:DNA mismatch repair ATPase MutS